MNTKVIKILNENNNFQYIDVLKRNREKRHKYKAFVVEGVKAIDRAVANKWNIKSFIYTNKEELSDWANGHLKNTKTEVNYELSLSLMNKLSDKEETSEMMAIVEIPKDTFERIKLKRNPLIVVFDRPSSPGNLGTIIRSCDSFKVDCLIMTGHAVDLYDPQTVRASVGSIFSIPVIRKESHKEVFEWIQQIKQKCNDLQIIGSSAKAEYDISKHDFKVPTVLLLGNETDGLSKNYKALCDNHVKIPIYGSASSLNVACAASIILYEIDRQRK